MKRKTEKKIRKKIQKVRTDVRAFDDRWYHSMEDPVLVLSLFISSVAIIMFFQSDPYMELVPYVLGSWGLYALIKERNKK